MCQETFLQVFRRLDRYDRERSSRPGLTIAYRRSLDMLRKRRRFSEFSAKARFEPAVAGRGGDPLAGRSHATAFEAARDPSAARADGALPMGQRRLYGQGHSPRSWPAGPRRPGSIFHRPPQGSRPCWRTIMDFCKTADILSTPPCLCGGSATGSFVSTWKDVHAARPAFSAAMRPRARSSVPGSGRTKALWHRIASEAGRAASIPETRPSGASRVSRWASAAAMAAVAALTGFWLSPGRSTGRLRCAGRCVSQPVRDRLRQRGRGARPDVRLSAPGTDTVFIWASRTP